MTTNIKKFFFLILIVLFKFSYSQVTFNEIQSSNDLTITDNFLEYDDWIELYNPTNTAIDLAGYFMSDDLNDPLKHQFKFGSAALTTIPANGYLLLWADDDEEQGTNHLNFKLNASGGETIFLISSDQTTIIDSLQLPAIKTDESYLKQPDGANTAYLNLTPTPGASNNTVSPYLSEPLISLKSGRYNGSQTISITADSGASIYYTTDGSTPTTNSAIYNGAITINSSQTIKAFAVKPGFFDSKMVYESYMLGVTSNLSIVNVSINPDYLFDDQVGMYVEGTNGIPGMCMDDPRNWWQDWEYEATVTLYEKNGDVGFNESCGIKISGGCGRNHDKKSFNIKFKDEYGIGTLNYKLFADSDADVFDGFKLRSAKLRNRIDDVFPQKTIENQIDIDLQYARPVALYLNGAYWGLYYIRDRINPGYLQTHHTKVDHDNIDYIKWPNSDGLWWEYAIEAVTQGDNMAYYQMHNFAVNNDLSIDANYKIATGQIDVNELINYLVCEIYLNNSDWPENNIEIWKERTPEGKWRWALFDLDRTARSEVWAGGGFINTTLFDEFLNNMDATKRRNPKSTELYRSLFENNTFRNEFVQRMNTYAQTIWNYNRTHPMFNELINEISPEMTAETNRWSGWDLNTWNTGIFEMDTFFKHRPVYARQMLKNVLSLGNEITLSLNADANTLGSVVMHQNFFEVPYNFSGTYFNDVELWLHAIPKPGYRFVEWQEIADNNYKYNQNLYKQYASNQTLTPIFEPALELVINEIYYNPTGTTEEEEFIELYNPDDKAKSLWGYQFTNGIQFQFPQNSIIQPGEYIVIAHNDSAYVGNGYQVFEWECGSLDNDGEAIVFSNPANEVLDSVYYNDNNFWNQKADGQGFSLALLDSIINNNVPTSWEAQTLASAISPGRKNDFCTAMQSSPTVIDVSCNGANDGFIVANISGGTRPLTYSWSNGQTNNVASNLSTGTHILTTTDLYNCTRVDSFTITEPTPLQASVIVTNAGSTPINNGAIDLTVTGGILPYTYSWSNTATTQDVVNIPAGTYSLSIADANNCPFTISNIEVFNDCLSNLIYNNQPQHTSGVYQVADFIQSNGKIEVTENISFQADTYIELNNSFEVEQNGCFEAIINGCD